VVRTAAAICIAVVIASCGGGSSPEPVGPATTPARPSADGVQRHGRWVVRTTAELAPIYFRAVPRLAFRDTGYGLAAAPASRGCAASTVVARVDWTTALGAPVTLPARLVAGPVPSAGRFTAVMSPDGRCAARSRLVLTDITSRGEVARRHELARDVPPGGVAIAAGVVDDVAVAWADASSRVRAVVRSPAGELTPAVALGATDDPRSIAITVSRNGAPLVAFVRRGGVRLMTMRPDGSVVRRRVLGPARGVTRIALDTGSRGRAVVLWTSATTGRYIVRAATKAANAETFGRARTLTVADKPAGGRATRVAALAARGRALAAFDVTNREAVVVVRYASAPPDRPIQTVRGLRYGSRLLDLAQLPDGTAAVALSRAGYLTVRERSAKGNAFVRP
jgi:hypothetical protein